jgi:hypothetical protein
MLRAANLSQTLSSSVRNSSQLHFFFHHGSLFFKLVKVAFPFWPERLEQNDD